MNNNSFAEDIVKKALKNGCDAAEVFIKNVKGISAEAKDGKVEALKASQDYGLALKVIKKQRLGFAFTTTADDIDKVINEAVEASAWTAVDEYAGIPDCMPSGDV
ncbi:MAG: hypothetical protein HY808_04225, partial [Nitrospirae bacterium]|nr:hypothetical protein [Nitrospirota bacterium]